MMWNVDGLRVDIGTLGALEPIDVLFEFEGPQIYVATHFGRPLLAYVSDCDDANELHRLLVVPTSEKLIADLKAGYISISDALRQPWLHAVDQTAEGHIAAVWHLPYGLDSVPDGYKPIEGTLISADLEPHDIAAPTDAAELLAIYRHVAIPALEIEVRQAVVNYVDPYHASLDVELANNLEIPSRDQPLNNWAQNDEAPRQTLH
jgi:hypothetical protein